MPEGEACPACHSAQLLVIGALGRLVWLRCRACGVDFPVPAEDLDEA